MSTGDHGDKMRVDCVNQCFGEKLDKPNNCLFPFYPRYILWRNDSAYSSYKDLKMCQIDYDIWITKINDERLKDMGDCEAKCRPDCINRYYNKYRFAHEKIDYNYVVPLNTTELAYFPNNLPNQITQHIEGMTFVDFSGNFGGLVGVWLGFSIATIISDLFVIIRDKYLKNFNIPI